MVPAMSMPKTWRRNPPQSGSREAETLACTQPSHSRRASQAPATCAIAARRRSRKKLPGRAKSSHSVSSLGRLEHAGRENMAELADPPVQPLDPVFHARTRTALQVRDAADICRENGNGLRPLQVRQLAVAKLVGELGLEHGIGSGRTAAKVALVERYHFSSEPAQQSLDGAANVL